MILPAGAKRFLQIALISCTLVISASLLVSIFSPSLLSRWDYLITLQAVPSPESINTLREVLSARAKLLPGYFRVRAASIDFTGPSTCALSVRARNDPVEFVSAFISPNVVDLREARIQRDQTEPPIGFSRAVLSTPQYDLSDISKFKYREQPIFLRDQPGVTIRRAKLVNVWNTTELIRQPVISIVLAEEDAQPLAELTGRLANGSADAMLALVIDGQVKTAGVVRERIEGGRVDLRDVPTKELAHFIGAIIQAGSLPADVTLRAEKLPRPAEHPRAAP